MKKIIVMGCWVMLAVAARAAGGWGFVYQAHLLDASGSPLVNSRGLPAVDQTVELRIYDKNYAKTPLWARSYSVRCDEKGLFNVFVSDSAGEDLLKNGLTLEEVLRHQCMPGIAYVGLTVKGGSEIWPRQRICAVPYANSAKVAQRLHVTDGKATASGCLKIKGDVTAQTLTMTGGTNMLTTAGNLATKKIIVSGNYDFISVPIGGIVLWPSSNAPDGRAWKTDGTSNDGQWARCNGRNGTPDLRGRFPRGTGDGVSLVDTGGAATVTLAVTNLPPHQHGFFARQNYLEMAKLAKGLVENAGESFSVYGSTAEGGVYSIGGWLYWGTPYFQQGPYTTDAKDDSSLVVAGTGKTGSGNAHNNMPSYCVVDFIMRIQ